MFVALFALLFIESFALTESDLLIIPTMCILCVAIPFVLVTIAPRFIPAAEVNLFCGNFLRIYLYDRKQILAVPDSTAFQIQ